MYDVTTAAIVGWDEQLILDCVCKVLNVPQGIFIWSNDDCIVYNSLDTRELY